MKSVPILKTQRLILREIREEDTDYIVGLRSNPEVYQYFLFPHRLTRDEHLSWFKNYYILDNNRIDWVAYNTDDKPIGVFGVKRDSEESGVAEISYILSPEEYGKGYASEAVKCLETFCKEEWKVNRIIAEINKNNSASIKLAVKLGLVEVAGQNNFLHFEKKSAIIP